MIAAGLCMMGGCFAQAENTAAVDTYWAAEKVAVPAYTSGGSVMVYGFSTTPAVPLAECNAYTYQVGYSGTLAFFRIYQAGLLRYNTFAITSFGKYIRCLQKWDGSSVVGIPPSGIRWPESWFSPFPCEATVIVDEEGVRYAEEEEEKNMTPCVWDSSLQGTDLYILDARASEKDFYVAYGSWGVKWYLLPMRSPSGATEAVFDFEEKVLVEL